MERSGRIRNVVGGGQSYIVLDPFHATFARFARQLARC